MACMVWEADNNPWELEGKCCFRPETEPYCGRCKLEFPLDARQPPSPQRCRLAVPTQSDEVITTMCFSTNIPVAAQRILTITDLSAANLSCIFVER